MNDLNTSLQADTEKRRAALLSVIWSLLLTLLKLGAGIATNSLGLLSEALHSALDLVAAGITYFAVRVASLPADRNHPYGYGKIENLSALLETMLLLLTCVWIVYEAADRLLFSPPEVVHSWWGIGVILISIVVDTVRSRHLTRVARKYKSQALEADALHFSTDILSSCVVLVGLAVLWGASRLAPGPLRQALEKTDALAALVVSGIVIWVGFRLCRRAINVLLDGGGKDYTEKLEQALTAQLPLYIVRKLRVRESGSAIFADLTLVAPGDLSLDAAHDIAGMVEAVAQDIMPGADVTVHIEPTATTEQNILSLVHTVAAAHGLSVHSLVLDDNNATGLCAYLHVETPSSMSLREAHALVDAFEASLSKRIGAVRVVSHIEPDDRYFARPERHNNTEPPSKLAEAVAAALAEDPAFPEPRDLEVSQVSGLCTVCFYCSVSGDLSVAEAHERATDMERRIRRRVHGIDRITIHMEPNTI